MSKILISNVMFYGFHGVYEYEREQGQKFFFDVELETDDKGAMTDDIDAAVDYLAVYEKVKEVAENKRFKLLEALTTYISKEIIADFEGVLKATVKVRKPNVPIHGPIDYVQVESSWSRE